MAAKAAARDDAAPAIAEAGGEASAGAGEEAAAAAASASSSAGAKRARTSLSLHEKAVVKSFCEQKVGESKARGELVPSQDQLRREIASKFGWACGRSTLSKIVSMDWKQLQQGALQNPNMKRQRRPLFPALEADLVKFIAAFVDGSAGGERALAADAQGSGQASVDAASDRLRGAKAVLTEALILEEAQRLKQVHGIRDEQLVLSVGWLARFKHRHGIRLRKAPVGTRGGADARARDVGDGRLVAAAAMPASVEAVNWSAVDPLLLSSTSNVLDALRVVDNDAVVAAKGTGDDHLAAVAPIERHVEVGPEPHRSVGDVSMELLTPFANPSALCGLFASSEPSDSNDSLWQSVLDKVPTDIRSLGCRCDSSELRALSREDMSGLSVVTVGANCTLDAFICASLVGDRGRVTCFEPVKAAHELGVRLADQYVRDALHYRPTAEPTLHIHGADSAASMLQSLRSTADIVLINCSLQTGDIHLLQRSLTTLSSLLKPGGELRFTALLHSPYYLDVCLLCQKLERQLDLRTLISPFFQASAAPFVGDAQTKFYRSTFRLFAIEDFEPTPEDYGQIAIYSGYRSGESDELSSSESAYRLDGELCFAKGERVAVDGNTARVLQTSWLHKFFTVEGEASRHRGGFQRAGWRAALHSRLSIPNEDPEAPTAAEDRLVMADI